MKGTVKVNLMNGLCITHKVCFRRLAKTTTHYKLIYRIRKRIYLVNHTGLHIPTIVRAFGTMGLHVKCATHWNTLGLHVKCATDSGTHWDCT
jgi:hypothetical protein